MNTHHPRLNYFPTIPSLSPLSSRFTSHSYPRSYPSSSRYKPKKPPKRTWTVGDDQDHPAFKMRDIGIKSPKPVVVIPNEDAEEGISLSEKGLGYKLKDAPFEFQYSYTETPKVKPVALREPPFLPFGPKETPRPWTGRAPLAKKKLPEFDSFKLPPAGKKGVKPVQAPGPFLPGQPTRVERPTRDQILGEELTHDEVADLVKGCLKTRRQLNMGRDGLTHNMLDNIHAHWKRRRVCKIKCKGVCTVDMDNVCHQLEEKVGGKVIHRQGGVIFLFRGRNYNYRTRPRFPLMLWRPIAPIYPKLVKRVPDGMTFDQADGLRKRGSKMLPICKLGKNGVYVNLVNQVREAFEACELVRVNCKGMNRSDYKKIGGKLKDLVPCVLLSFEFEHILMWRGKDWKPSLLPVEIDGSDSSICPGGIDGSDEARSSDDSAACDISENNSERMNEPSLVDESESESKSEIQITSTNDDKITEMSLEKSDRRNMKEPFENNANQILRDFSNDSTELSESSKSIEQTESESQTECLEGVRLRLDQAMGSGSAVILSEIEGKDSDLVYQRSVELAKTAQLGPTFQVRIRKKELLKKDKFVRRKPDLESGEPEQESGIEIPVLERGESKIKGRNIVRRRKDELLELLPSVVPQGSLGIDELAKLLS